MRNWMNMNRMSKNPNLYSLTPVVTFLLALTAVCSLAPTKALGQASTVVFSQANGVIGLGSSPTTIDYSGTAGHMAANSRGDLFIPVSSNNMDFLEEIPAKGGSSAAVSLLAPSSGGANSTGNAQGVFVDSANNLYATYSDQGPTYNSAIVYIPFVNGGYATGTQFGNLSNCSAFPVPATTAAPCKVPFSNYLPSSTGNYIQPADVALDGSGNLYILTKYVGGSYNGGTILVIEIPAANPSNSSILPISGLSNGGGAEIAVDKAGDVFAVDGYGNNRYLPAGANASFSPGGLYYIDGVSMDAGGNAYFTQSNGATGSSIIVVPAGSNVCNNSGCSSSYTLTNQLSTGYTSNPSLGVAITGTGNLYFAGSYPNSISSVTVSEFSFGSEAVGSTSGATTLVAFPTNYSVFDHFSVTGPFAVSSTTCNKGQAYFQYSSPQFCSVSVTYTATAPGPQTGTIQEYDQYGNRLGVATLSGTGLAPTINVDPGTVSAIGSGWTAPNAIAVDNAGNTYVADYTTGKVYKNASTNAIASGFVHPSALAVDSAGDLYVGDAGNARIVEVPYNIATTSYGTAVVLTTGLSGVSGLALDSNGNLYVADSGHSRVLLLSTAAGQPLGSLPSTLGSGFTTPVALAIDNAQNLYISDSGSNKVFQYSISTGTQATILSGLTKAAGVSVDATGGLFAVDSGAKTIVHVPSVSGVLNKNNAVTIGTIVATPTAIATDSFGNLYVADTADATVGKMNRSVGVLPFGNEEIMLASTSTSAIVSNGGTQSVTLGSPYYTATYSPTNSSGTYALQSSSTCANGTALSAGSACSITATFTPASTGPYSEILTLASSPATTATLQFTGTGVNLPKTTTTISTISPTSPSYGQTVTVTATVAPVVTGTQPTGTVSFSVDSVPQVPAVALSGSTASLQLTGLTGGSHTITASYNGSPTYAPSASATYNLTIGKSSTTTAASILSSTVYTNPTSQVPGTGVTFNVTVTPGLPGTPTGTITLYTTGSATALGSGPLTPNGTAAITLNTLQLGQYNIYAVYGGDPNYSGSSSTPTLPLLISNPTIQLTTSATSITGGGAAITLTAYSVAGYGTISTTTGALDLGCTGLPSYAVCSFSPPVAQVNSTTSATILLSVTINQPPVIAVPAGIGGTSGGRGGFALLLSAMLLLPVGLAGLALRRGNRRLTGLLGRGRIALLAVLLLAGCTAAFSGCGGSLNGSYNTPAGTSTIGVTGTISNGTVNPAPAVTLPLQLIVH